MHTSHCHAPPTSRSITASPQAKLLKDTSRVVAVVIALRSALPGADLGAMISRQPRLLLREPAALTADAEQVGVHVGGLLARQEGRRAPGGERLPSPRWAPSFMAPLLPRARWPRALPQGNAYKLRTPSLAHAHR